jgi:hypothetical protein
MRRISPFLRGLLVIAAIAVIVIVLQLYATLIALGILLRLAFILAIVFFLYLVWRENRGAIALWSLRAQMCFYGAALLIVTAIGVNWYYGATVLERLAFYAVIVICAVAMYRVWRDQRHHGSSA